MGMQPYYFNEKAALAVDSVMAAAILLHDSYANYPGELDPWIRSALDSMACYQAAGSGTFRGWLDAHCYFDIDGAFEVLRRATGQAAFCNEMTGSAETADGFRGNGAKTEVLCWKNEPALFLTAKRQMSLFKAAYGSPEELVDEYREIMEPYLGEGFDYAPHIYDVSGCYYC